MVYVPVSSALPGWTAYIDSVQQTQVQQNAYDTGLAVIDIFGPNYPAAEPSPGIVPGVIDGNYSVLLQAGAEPGTSGVTTGVSIAQTGTVPDDDQWMQFRAWETYWTGFTVSFDGNSLSPVVLGTGANYTLYGVNIAPYSGQTGQLEFTADFVTPGSSWLGLDDIAFAATPEPSPLVLTGIGGVLFALYRRFALKRQ